MLLNSHVRIEEHGNIKARISIVFIVVLAFFGIIGTRLFEKQIVRYDHYQGLAYNQRYKEEKILPARGEIFVTDIYSDTKYPLVTNKTFWSVMIIPQQVEDATDLANRLGPVIGMAAGDIITLLSQNRVYIPPIKRKQDDAVSKKIEELGLSGVVLIPETYRDYPEGNMGAKFLGFVDAQGEGKYGVEGYLNDVLRGEEGASISERDILGRQITVADSKLILPKNGKDVVLTIDHVIQYMAEEAIKNAVEKHSADSGSVVIMNPKNGDILALAEYPTYDPAKYGEVKDYSIFQCMAVSDGYEPGSVFKALAMAAGIDAGAVTPDTGSYFEANVKVDGETIWNSQRSAYGYETMAQVLENSDNVGMVWMIDKLGKDKFYDYIDAFGFGKPTGVEIEGEAAGLIQDKEDVPRVGVATMAFGQGITTTEMQLLQSMGVIANGGLMIKPHIVKEYIDKDGTVKKVDPQVLGRVISEKSANDISKMLVSVSERGHGKQSRVKGYRIGGKTGTAQIPKKDGRGYETTKFTGSFMGIGPMDDPLFVMVVRINVPKDVIWAETVAAPTFGDLAKGILNYYQIPPDESWKAEQIKREKGQIK